MGTTHLSYADLDEYDSDNSFYRVNTINNRVQSAFWFETDVKERKDIFDLDQGYTIAESFAREKYPEFWKTSDTRNTKVITKNKLENGKNSELQYVWWEIYYAPDENITHYSEIPGLNSVSVTVSPYSGHIIGYSEIYTPSVVSGISPVNLTPALTDGEAQMIAETEFRTMGADTNNEPELLSLRLTNDLSNDPHLTWNFAITRTQKIGSKDDESEYIERAIVSVDAHDGIIARSTPFN
jgi:hypothetical protein